MPVDIYGRIEKAQLLALQRVLQLVERLLRGKNQCRSQRLMGLVQRTEPPGFRRGEKPMPQLGFHAARRLGIDTQRANPGFLSYNRRAEAGGMRDAADD